MIEDFQQPTESKPAAIETRWPSRSWFQSLALIIEAPHGGSFVVASAAMPEAAMPEAAMSEAAVPEAAVETTEVAMIYPMVMVEPPIGQIDKTITRVMVVPAIMDELICRTGRSNHRSQTCSWGHGLSKNRDQ